MKDHLDNDKDLEELRSKIAARTMLTKDGKPVNYIMDLVQQYTTTQINKVLDEVEEAIKLQASYKYRSKGMGMADEDVHFNKGVIALEKALVQKLAHIKDTLTNKGEDDE